ncbi:PaaI family thioesterase [Achromobacter aloeverae]
MNAESTVRTHRKICSRLSGRVVRLAECRSEVELALSEEMAADDMGLVHGGFLFSAADYAAMLAVNDPLVVLAGANVRFLLPSRVGEVIRFVATADPGPGRKRNVAVQGRDAAGRIVFDGVFTCVVLARHALEKDDA